TTLFRSRQSQARQSLQSILFRRKRCSSATEYRCHRPVEGNTHGAEQVFREKRVGSRVRNAPRGESLDARKRACAAIGRGGAPDQGKNAADIRGHILEAGQAVQESGSEYVRGIGRIPVPRSVVCPG